MYVTNISFCYLFFSFILYMAQISKDGEILNRCHNKKNHHLGMPRMALFKKSACCSRSQLSAAV